MWFRLVLVCLLFTFSFLDSFAQLTGCRKAGMIYHTPPSFLYGWTDPISETCGPGATTSTQYLHFVRNVPAAPACPVGLLSLGGTGILVEYTVLFCPLDKLLAILIVPAVIIGFLSLRKL
jgi:hypothetical protein